MGRVNSLITSLPRLFVHSPVIRLSPVACVSAERRAFFDAAKLERGIVLEGRGEHVPIITSGSSVEALDRTIVRKSTDPSQVPFDYKRIGSAF